jgi:hypothetical protein
MTSARRRLAFLSAAIAVIAAVLAVLVPFTSAPTAAACASETRVGPSHSGMIFTVGPSQAVSAGQGRGEGLSQPHLVAGACVAAEDAEGAAGGGLRFTVNGAGDTTVSYETAAGDTFNFNTHSPLRLTQRGVPLDQATVLLEDSSASFP